MLLFELFCCRIVIKVVAILCVTNFILFLVLSDLGVWGCNLRTIQEGCPSTHFDISHILLIMITHGHAPWPTPRGEGRNISESACRHDDNIDGVVVVVRCLVLRLKLLSKVN